MPKSSFEAYSKILALSQRMAELAVAEDWDALVAIERDRAALIATLPALPHGLSVHEGQQLASIIDKIMTHDATVREHVEPWLEHVAILLPASASRP